MHFFQGMISFAEIGGAVPVIISLIVIEGLLSVDNAPAIASLASRLPPAQRRTALRLGILGAYLFRAAALLIASWIIANPWIRIVGAGYLIYLMCAHLTEGDEAKAGHAEGKAATRATFWSIFVSIQFIDLSLSVDNVIAAVALSSKFWVVCTGVFIGILVLRLLVGFCIRLLARFPILEPASFLLVGYVGFLLLAQSVLGVEIGSGGKFIGIVAILSAALLYDRFPGIKAALTPAIRGSLILMRLASRAVHLVFRPVGWLMAVSGLAERWRRRKAREEVIRLREERKARMQQDGDGLN